MAKRSALGKGLGAFFGDDVVKSTGTDIKKKIQKTFLGRKKKEA